MERKEPTALPCCLLSTQCLQGHQGRAARSLPHLPWKIKWKERNKGNKVYAFSPCNNIKRFGLPVTAEVQSWDQSAHASEETNSEQHWARMALPSLKQSLTGHSFSARSRQHFQAVTTQTKLGCHETSPPKQTTASSETRGLTQGSVCSG